MRGFAFSGDPGSGGSRDTDAVSILKEQVFQSMAKPWSFAAQRLLRAMPKEMLSDRAVRLESY
jgi:hypothetical protein